MRSGLGHEAPVRDESLVRDDVRLHYRDWGDPAAPPVLLLHGNFQHARSWDPVARGLAARYRVIAPDWRGHGESDWASAYTQELAYGDLEALIASLGLRRFPVVGNSLGGRMGAVYAAHHPEQVECLVMLQGFVTPSGRPEVGEQIDRLLNLPERFADLDEAVEAFRAVAPYASDDVLRQFVTDSLKQDTDSRWISRIDAPLLARSTMSSMAPTTDGVRALLPQVTCPVLLTAGAQSFMDESMRQMVALLHDARIATIPNAEHVALVDNPDGVLDAVRRFLDEVAPGPSTSR
jgi:pimeloyl-ACP methyl ester carboxylesterase